MRTVSALDVRAKFGQILDEAAAGERFVVQRAGVPLAAIVPLTDLAVHDPDAEHRRRLAAIEELFRLGRQNHTLRGPVDAASLVRDDRDQGHSV